MTNRAPSQPRHAPPPRQVGEILVDRGVITRAKLAETLQRQTDEGGRLGRLLTADGDVARRDLYGALAEAWSIPFVDLVADPPDPVLLGEVGPDTLLAGHWVPHRALDEITDGELVRTLVVATAERPDEHLDAAIRAVIRADHIHYRATTDWDIDQAVLLGCQDAIVDEAADGLAESTPELSARTTWCAWQRVALWTFGILVTAAALVFPSQTLVTGLLAVNLLFLAGVTFKIAACIAGMIHVRRIERDGPQRDPHHHDSQHGALELVPRTPDRDLPNYTILVPAYREANVVSKVIEHVLAIDYPLSKLRVLLLMEASDHETIAAARAARPPDCVRFVVVPAGGPQTKPKACNVGLALADGEFLVIYDAEDLPEPGQLREAVARFAQADDDVVCFQARLNYFNARENILTRMFTLEYSFWFDYMLPGLDAWQLPIPLGGTSNHFRVDQLREIGGWDPYNVTEDADLGVRASAVGLKIGITDSTTWEEACSEWKAWIRQRTRWIKGYMTTALVHTRRPLQFWRTCGLRGVVGLLGLIAGTPAMFLACPLVWAFWLFTFLGGSVPGFHMPDWVQTATTINLLAGNGAMIGFTALAARRRRQTHLIPYALLTPAYWTLHSIAAWRALWQLVVRPAHWEKTPHGIVHGPERFAATPT
jgi:cellulose synthase/poly-beta-1,6-N-acetylglucosamine synthase-like glycosyltransferase